MGLREDVDMVEELIYEAGRGRRLPLHAAWERVRAALNIPEPEPIDTRATYQCGCGETWKSDSDRDQYCVKCGKKMEIVN